MEKPHIISLLVEDRFGVLQRVASIFSRRGFNMNTITVGVTNQEGMSRMTILAKGDDKKAEQIVKQLSKLPEVIKVGELFESDCVVREIALLKVFVKDYASRSEIMNFTEIFRAKVVDVSKSSMMIEMTGTTDKVDALIDLLKPFGIKEMVRTGITALPRE